MGHITRTLFYYIWKDLTQHIKLVLMVSLALAFSLLGFFVSSSLLAGFKQILTDSAINAAGHIVIKPKEGDKYIDNSAKLIEDLRKINHVEAVAARLNLPLQVSSKGNSVGTLGFGVVEQYERQLSVVPKNIIKGKFFRDDETEKVVLGKFLADDLEGISDDDKLVTIGSKIKVTTAAGRQREYEVVGITDTKNVFYNNFLFFPKKEAENLLFSKDKLSEISLKLDSTSNIDAVKKAANDLNYPVRIFSWDEQAQYIHELINTFSVVANLINIISLFAAATVMFVVISINTERKRKEIATMRSLGTSPTFLIFFFVFEGIIYTFLGATIGAPLFYTIHLKFQATPLELILGDLKTVINNELVILSFGLFFAITLVAGIYPAWKAAKKTPIRILWRG